MTETTESINMDEITEMFELPRMIELNPMHSTAFQIQFPEAYQALKDMPSDLELTSHDLRKEIMYYSKLAATRGLLYREIVTFWRVLNAKEIKEGEKG